MLTDRQIKMHLPPAMEKEALLFHRLTGSEGLSRLFEYEVELLSHQDDLDIDKILGHEMSVGLELSTGVERYFHGYVASFGHVDFHEEFSVYRAILRPNLWRLTRTTDSRIFSKK